MSISSPPLGMRNLCEGYPADYVAKGTEMLSDHCLCLSRLHAASVSLLQRNWYGLMLLSLTEPRCGLTLRSRTAVGLGALIKCVDALTHTHTHPPSRLVVRSQPRRRARAGLVRRTLMEMSCLVSSMENWAELMLISSQQQSAPLGIQLILKLLKGRGKWGKKCGVCRGWMVHYRESFIM